MNAIQCWKTSMPVLHPEGIWKTSGRWKSTGLELMRLSDRHGENYCLAPTHEEMITELASSTISSYKELPLRLYQIGTKFRDEIRPRYGLIRAKEFVMKDAYTFDLNTQEANVTYDAFVAAYHRILTTLKVPYVQVEADSGNIGGQMSHEFQILCEHGEDVVLSCNTCEYVANEEKAEGRRQVEDMTLSFSPPTTTVDRITWVTEAVEQCPQLQVLWYTSPQKKDSVFAVLYATHDGINEIKLKKEIQLLHSHVEEISILQKTDVPSTATVIVLAETQLQTDMAIENLNSEKGAFHWCNFRKAAVGDTCPCCDGHLEEKKGIEVGHTFYLGDKYSSLFKTTVMDTNQKIVTVKMGCYGMGVSRLLQAVVESHHDDHGIRWSNVNVAPYQAVVISIGNRRGDDECSRIAAEIAKRLDATVFHNNVVLDDRYKESPGSKMTEAELLGYPYSIIVGRSFTKTGQVEVRERWTGHSELCEPAQLQDWFLKKTTAFSS